MTWNELDSKKQRKALILGGLVALSLVILSWPSNVSRGQSAAQPTRPIPQRPSPAARSENVVRADIPQPILEPDPNAKLWGKWQGTATLADRGICTLSLELRRGSEPESFAGASTFSCVPNPWQGAVERTKDPTGFIDMMQHRLNPTSATFEGAAEGGGIALHATDNIGVSEAFQGCDMVSMTLKTFDDSRMSLRWQESGKPVCKGGEMLLGRPR